MPRGTKKSVDERVDEERGAASEPPKSAKEHAYEIRHRGVVEADEYSTGTESPSPETREVVRHSLFKYVIARPISKALRRTSRSGAK